MLNALKLSEFLAKNVDPNLYPRMFVMSPNGTLMAYSTPVDIKDLRDQAALISMAWKEHEANLQAKRRADAARSDDSFTTSPLETLTIEFQHNNIIIRAIQPKLLLVLVGGVPPSRRTMFKITPEAYGDPRYPQNDAAEVGQASSNQPDEPPSSVERSLLPGVETGEKKRKPASISSRMSQREKDMKTGVLHIQRKKIDALTDFLRQDFDAKGFVMPDDSSFP
ncbi:uncharacterized protein BDR25DRAFT_302665 [Lindgomyces ingoldianus]|uniref:Uncharacterized protein n=1 Tax=Lindgomyces ingoldianus TaxID=673940 RepID=A0ACB6QZU8_9PLEO|nr:uncharacterized protein BDR25DRAFT_302665 [Lindgomyces ingoldianus]KAF2472514.1 hypothetical protein BDR25DRAFT_302665 [Lindgomyces ingoldianus]